jgi:hypothetical protein
MRADDGLGAVVDAQLGEDARHVVPHGLLREVEPAG